MPILWCLEKLICSDAEAVFFFLEFPSGKLQIFFQTATTTAFHRTRSYTWIEKNSIAFSLTPFFLLSYRATKTSNNNSFLRLLFLFFFACATCYCEQKYAKPILCGNNRGKSGISIFFFFVFRCFSSLYTRGTSSNFPLLASIIKK